LEPPRRIQDAFEARKEGGLSGRKFTGAAVRIAQSVRTAARDGSKLCLREAPRKDGRKNAGQVISIKMTAKRI
jgi:hypothetical protein